MKTGNSGHFVTPWLSQVEYLPQVFNLQQPLLSFSRISPFMQTKQTPLTHADASMFPQIFRSDFCIIL